MHLCMKTTVDISDSLYEEARIIAAGEKSSIKALIEEGLRKVIEERKHRQHFKLRKATFKWNGLQAELADASWDKIREKVYEGRGGWLPLIPMFSLLNELVGEHNFRISTRVYAAARLALQREDNFT